MNKDRLERLLREASSAPPNGFVDDMLALWDIVAMVAKRMRRPPGLKVVAATPTLERATQ